MFGGAEFGGPVFVHVLRLYEGVGIGRDSPLTCVAFLGRVYLAGAALCVSVCGAVCLWSVRLLSVCLALCVSVSLCLVLFSRRRAVRGSTTVILSVIVCITILLSRTRS